MTAPEQLRLCVIGNSHTVPVRANWTKVAGLDVVDATFFCAGGRKLECLKVEDDAVVPDNDELAETLMRTSRGVGRIVPGDYDAALVVGLQTGIRRLWGLYASHRLAEHAGPRHVVISDACLDTTIDAMLAKSTAVKVFTMLAPLGLRRVYLVPDPNTPEQYAVDRKILANVQINAFLAAAFGRGLRRLAAHHDVTVIHQRAETMRDGLTLANYSLAADDLEEGRETSLVRMLHGSNSFGLLVAQDVAAALARAA
jgi:hypothetical protein